MSDLSVSARVQIFLADYASNDGSNKVSALGVGFQVSGIQTTGFTAPMALVVLVEFPPGHVGEDFAFETGLYDDVDELVVSPGLAGAAEATPLRFAQHITLEQAVVQMPGLRIPRDALWSRQQIVLNFQNGLPLAVGRGYEWRVHIDTDTRPDWSVGFYVPGPAGGIVVG